MITFEDKKKRLREARQYVLASGKHKGKTLAEVIKEDWYYVQKIYNGDAKSHSEVRAHINTIINSSLFFGEGTDEA